MHIDERVNATVTALLPLIKLSFQSFLKKMC